MRSDSLARLATLLELVAPTMRLCAEAALADGELSRVTELSLQIEAIAAELISITTVGRSNNQHRS